MVYNDLLDSRVTRVTGQDEAHAVDVSEDTDGKKRLKTKSKVMPMIDGTTGDNVALSVGTSPVELRTGTFRLTNRCVLLVQVTSGPVWLGAKSSVTTSNGIKLVTGREIKICVSDNVPLYVISDSSGRSIRLLELPWSP